MISLIENVFLPRYPVPGRPVRNVCVLRRSAERPSRVPGVAKTMTRKPESIGTDGRTGGKRYFVRRCGPVDGRFEKHKTYFGRIKTRVAANVRWHSAVRSPDKGRPQAILPNVSRNEYFQRFISTHRVCVHQYRHVSTHLLVVVVHNVIDRYRRPTTVESLLLLPLVAKGPRTCTIRYVWNVYRNRRWAITTFTRDDAPTWTVGFMLVVFYWREGVCQDIFVTRFYELHGLENLVFCLLNAFSDIANI